MAAGLKPSPPSCIGPGLCIHIRHAAIRKHTTCVKHFWGLCDESDVQEKLLLEDAATYAYINRDTATLEFLLSNHCPLDEGMVASWGFSSDWRKWRDTYLIALKYKIPQPQPAVNMLRRALERCDWDFLKNAQEYGYDVEKEANIHFANQPDIDVPALKAFLTQDAFSTVKLPWLTPQFASERNDQALLEFGLQLQGTHDLSEAAA